MIRERKIRRRGFLGKSATLGLGALVAPAVFPTAGRVLGASDKLVMGIIGSGGRGRSSSVFVISIPRT